MIPFRSQAVSESRHSALAASPRPVTAPIGCLGHRRQAHQPLELIWHGPPGPVIEP